MNITQKAFLMTLFAVAFSSCATKKIDQSVDAKLAQTAPVNSVQELHDDTTNTITSTPGITEDQRAKLIAIQKSTEQTISALRAESLKMRELLVQEVVRTDGYNDNEVNRIKTRLKDIESKRLVALFKGVDDANDVLGHQTQRKKVIDSMMRMDRYDNGFSSAQNRENSSSK